MALKIITTPNKISARIIALFLGTYCGRRSYSKQLIAKFWRECPKRLQSEQILVLFICLQVHILLLAFSFDFVRHKHQFTVVKELSFKSEYKFIKI